MLRAALLTLLAATIGGPGFAARANPSQQAPLSYAQIFCRKYARESPAVPDSVRRALDQPKSLTFHDAEGVQWLATPKGLIEIPASGSKTLITAKSGLPITALTGIAGGPDGRLWLATQQGAICFVPHAAPGERWFYFWGNRYLADNEVLQIAAGDNQAWMLTRSGISHITFKPYTLEAKGGFFLRRLRARHDRYGYVADCELRRPGDVSSFVMVPSDNDGLWTSIYVAAESLRYAATRSPQALWNARASLRALLRLVSITGIPGFPARSLIHRGDVLPPGGEWHWTPDGQWKWKGDTSSDELVGHFFAYWVAYKLLPDNGDRAQIRQAVAAIAGGLVKHHLTLVGYGGRVTTWGHYDPAYFETAKGRDDKALDSLEILSHLRVAYAITHEARFIEAYRRVANRLGYVHNVMAIGDEPHEVNYSDEELAFLSFYPLMQAESDPALRGKYQEALTRLWRRVRGENNPLWNYIYAVTSGAKPYGCAAALNTLERIPMDTVSWTVDNSQRTDLTIRPRQGRFGELQSTTALPPDERYVTKWNSDPFQLNVGDGGRSEDDGAFFLLPYWLGRYNRLLVCKSD